jgi:hypothetical protein
MRYREILEVYSLDNSYLAKFLKNEEFDAYDHWWAVCNTIMKNDQYRRAMSRLLKKKITSGDDIEDEDAGIFYKLPKNIQAEVAQDTITYLLQNDPAEAPTTAYLSLRNKNKPMIHRLTWLVHFTDEPTSIAEEGFKIGMNDPNKLGLTTYTKNTSFDKSDGGYNFAFIADSRDAKNAAHGRHGDSKYGKHAVMFQNSGVHAYHNGDEEDQIIFWGSDVNPRNIIVLKHLDDWTVIGKTFYYKETHPTFDKELYKGDFEKCVAWIMNNFQQYRKALTGF